MDKPFSAQLGSYQISLERNIPHYEARQTRTAEEKAVSPRRMPRTNMAEIVHHTFGRKSTVSND
jgi:hypothetical protein